MLAVLLGTADVFLALLSEQKMLLKDCKSIIHSCTIVPLGAYNVYKYQEGKLLQFFTMLLIAMVNQTRAMLNAWITPAAQISILHQTVKTLPPTPSHTPNHPIPPTHPPQSHPNLTSNPKRSSSSGTPKMVSPWNSHIKRFDAINNFLNNYSTWRLLSWYPNFPHPNDWCDSQLIFSLNTWII